LEVAGKEHADDGAVDTGDGNMLRVIEQIDEAQQPVVVPDGQVRGRKMDRGGVKDRIRERHGLNGELLVATTQYDSRFFEVGDERTGDSEGGGLGSGKGEGVSRWCFCTGKVLNKTAVSA
jgi:hypothetical protein